MVKAWTTDVATPEECRSGMEDDRSDKVERRTIGKTSWAAWNALASAHFFLSNPRE